MAKKKLFVFLMFSLGLVFANDNSQASSPNSSQKNTQKQLNSPSVGSRQYSNGNFALPQVKGKKGQRYYTDKELNNSAKQAQVAGSASYSSRSTAKTKLTGKKGRRYYTKSQLSNGLNQPTQGSRVGSNQVFNYPGKNPDKENNSSAQ